MTKLFVIVQDPCYDFNRYKDSILEGNLIKHTCNKTYLNINGIEYVCDNIDVFETKNQAQQAIKNRNFSFDVNQCGVKWNKHY